MSETMSFPTQEPATAPVRVLQLGTGKVAQRHVESYRASGIAQVVAAADTDAQRLDAFCADNEIGIRYGNLSEALCADTFDAVSNATPDAAHFATTMDALKTGKHVFCEKPLALSYGDAATMARAAEELGLVNMINLTYRQGGAIHEARRLVLDGAIGEVRHVNARYLQSWLVGDHWGAWRESPAWLWRLSKTHGSTGALGDVGIHILDYASFGAASEIVGLSCQLRTFPKAEGDRIGEYTFDANDAFIMLVDFANGAFGTVQATRYATGHSNDVLLEIFGTAGGLRVHGDTYWSTLETCLGPDVHTQRWTPVEFPRVPTLFANFARSVLDGTQSQPDFRRGADLQQLIDLAMERGERRSIEPVGEPKGDLRSSV
ncbi:MAG: Gfo/Idh/MocA family oxidoreductase [Pseudomonadota bacterium]